MPCRIEFRCCPAGEWEIGQVRIRAARVTHPGPTLGFRVSDGETSLCYLPDHEPALEPSAISGQRLARGCSLLIHDCQYTDDEYPQRAGWGHSRVSDALDFAWRSAAEQVVLFHHDPLHSDHELDRLHADAQERWHVLGGHPDRLGMAVEGSELSTAQLAMAA